MVILYKTESCPRCAVLKRKLIEKNIDFKEITDVDVMIELGIVSAPMLQIGDQKKLLSFKEAIDWVNSMEV